MWNLLRFSLLMVVPVTLSYVITDQLNRYLNPGFSYWNPFWNNWNLQSPVVFASGMSEFPTEFSHLTGKTGTQNTAGINRRYIPELFSSGFAFEPRFHMDKVISAGADVVTLPPPKKGSEFKLNFELPKIFKNGQNEDTSTSAKRECDNLRGSFILGECYIYSTAKRKFRNAMDDCRFRGGQIWTPDLNNPALFVFMAQAFPSIIAAAHESRLWLGASILNGRVKTLSGDDITDDFFVQINCNNVAFVADQCLFLKFLEGGLCVKSEDCEKEYNYVCEIPLKANHQVDIHKYLKG